MFNLLFKVLVSIAIPLFAFAQDSDAVKNLRERRRALLAIKVEKYGTEGALKALNRLKTEYGPMYIGGNVFGFSHVTFQNSYVNQYPSSPASPASKAVEQGTTDIFIDVIGKQIPQVSLLKGKATPDRGLYQKEKEEAIDQLNQLMSDYDSGKIATDHDRVLARMVLLGYFNIDVEKGLDGDDLDFADFKREAEQFGLTQKMIEDANGNIVKAIRDNQEAIIKTVNDRSKDIVSDFSKVLDNKINKLRKENGTLVEDQASQNQRIESRLNFLRDRVVRKDVKVQIAGSDSFEFGKIVERSKTCNQEEIECSILIKELGSEEDVANLQFEKTFNDSLEVGKGMATLFGNIAGVTGSPELANLSKNISGTVFVIETFDKMGDLLSSALISGGMAALGDVTSMANLAVGLIGAFGGGGKSADAVILEQIQKIREEIQELRKEMHERFDSLEEQLVTLGLSMDNQFVGVNNNLVVLQRNDLKIVNLIESQSTQISQLAELALRESLYDDLKTLSSDSNLIVNNGKRDEVLSQFSKLVANYSALASNMNNVTILSDAQDQLTGADDLIGIHATFGSELNSVSSVVDYQWTAYLARLARYSNLIESNPLCGNINLSSLSNFNLTTGAVIPAFLEEYDSPEKSGSLVANKFEDYLLEAQKSPESSLYDQLRAPLENYKTTVGNLEGCFNQYSIKSGGHNYLQHLVDLYKQRVHQYFTLVANSVNSENMQTLLKAAIKDPRSGLFKQIEGKTRSTTDENRRGLVEISKVEQYKNWDDFLEKETIDSLIKKMVPTMHSCVQPDQAPIETPVKLLKSMMPKMETWASLYFGLNHLDFCYVLPETIAHEKLRLGGFSIQVQISGTPELAGIEVGGKWYQDVLNHNVFIWAQNFGIPWEHVEGKDFTKQEQKSVIVPGTEAEPQFQYFTVTTKYKEIDREKFLNNWIYSGEIRQFNNACFSHKGALVNCIEDSTYDQYLRIYQVQPQRTTPYAGNEFINVRTAHGAGDTFDKLALDIDTVKAFFEEAKTRLDNCRAQIALNGDACKFGEYVALKESADQVTKLSAEVFGLQQMIRATKNNLMNKVPTVEDSAYQAFVSDLDLVLMTPKDISELILADQEKADFATNTEKVVNELDEGYNYIIEEIPLHMEFDFSPLIETESYQQMEALLNRFEARQLIN